MSGTIRETPNVRSGTTEIGEVEVYVRDLLHGRIRELHLRAFGRGVVLEGNAPSYYAKQLAQNAVMKATALPILKNEIEVC